MVCFECRARLSSFVQFRSRALRAENLLARVPASCRRAHSLCLTTLKWTTISPRETIHINGDAVSFGDLVEVKIEVVEPESEVKPKTPLDRQPAKKPKRERRSAGEDVKTNVKAEVAAGNDDANSDAASEGDEPTEQYEPKQTEDPLITMHFTAHSMDLAEVRSHMAKTRALARYKSALYKCDKCAQIFISESQFIAHNTRHSAEQGAMKCEVCEHRFKSDKALARHSATHFTRYACRHCTSSCFSYHQMQVHYRNVHDRKTRRQCAKCHATFTQYRQLVQHRQRAHARQHPCPVCGRQFRSSAGLWRHHFVHDETVPELECHICHNKYKGEFYLKEHIRNVHETTPGGAYCAECDMHFKSTNDFKKHLKRTIRHMPSEDKTYKCDYCGKRFGQKPTLTQHIEVTHLRLLKYKCNFCDDKFNAQRYVTDHMRRIHSVEPRDKRHVCHICAKAFSIKKCLEEHMNSHLGVRPYECKMCGATFAYNAALYTHNRLVHLKIARKTKQTRGDM